MSGLKWDTEAGFQLMEQFQELQHMNRPPTAQASSGDVFQ